MIWLTHVNHTRSDRRAAASAWRRRVPIDTGRGVGEEGRQRDARNLRVLNARRLDAVAAGEIGALRWVGGVELRRHEPPDRARERTGFAFDKRYAQCAGPGRFGGE